MLSIVESIKGIVEALRNISRCNDDPRKLTVGSVEREPQIRLFRPRWESCGGVSPLPHKNKKNLRPRFFFPPPPFFPHHQSTTREGRRSKQTHGGSHRSHIY